jgi:hypothetical protein
MSVQSTGLSRYEKWAGRVDDMKPDSLTKPDPLANYYTDDDLARIFKKSKRTIARWRAQRRLPFTTAGKTPLSSHEHVRKFLEAGEKAARRR